MLEQTRQITVARELTKIHEENLRGTVSELLERLKDREIKGEIVLLISGRPKESRIDWLELTPEEHVRMIEENYNLSHLDAIKMAAKLRGVPKREIYQITEKSINLT
jgi:16S rRNA (cytidine1402-2'-O)-methyltransferase